MAKTIAFINEKGGVGKSSLCLNTAWCLAEQGMKVLMIDLDAQRANLTFFAGIEKTPDILTLYDVLADGVDIKETVLMVTDNLDIIPATVDVSGLDTLDMSPQAMALTVEALKPYYDAIFVDVSPSPNKRHVLAMAISDGLILPMLPDVASLEANMGMVETIELAKAMVNPGLKVYGILFNRYTWRASLSRQVAAVTKEMAEAMSTRVFKSTIRQAVVLSENIGQSMGITSYASKSPAAEDIRNFCEELKGVLENE